ncbi:MAG: hypothetical protein HC910_07975 [Spirulinaceae cyanobacterium SM2_1_0]|nr:hypothetical protein [Spirulinaceae cyanobacterium SM2_1_0]
MAHNWSSIGFWRFHLSGVTRSPWAGDGALPRAATLEKTQGWHQGATAHAWMAPHPFF